ncbi:MAG TPA: glycosyltransferase 87 family protein, partial [Bryobacteraceae bacterium]|nr:glycosyltransferase 87 family protein [Bryobacteraceae bacterium]
MTLTRSAQRALIVSFCAVLAAIYAIAWLAPSIGLFHDDAIYLVTAKSLASGHGYTIESLPTPIPQTKYPPLFPALLALFTLISRQTQWLKLLPVLCTVGWLALSYRLLRKMGAQSGGAWLLVLLTAASPMVVFLGTNLLSEPLFALLVTAALLALLDDRAVPAGVLAGLATLTRSAGVPLIVACVLVLIIRRRLRSAALFTAAAMAMAAPWFGWALAHSAGHPYYSGANYAASNILTGYSANEKLAIFGSNILLLLASPFHLLTGIVSTYAAAGTAALAGWSLFRRRQLMPDLFVALYCLMLLLWAWPPQRFVAPILPLILWMLWRVFQNVRIREALAAVVVILLALPLWTDISRIPKTLRYGQFPTSNVTPGDWSEMGKLFTYIREQTPADAVICANLDPVFYLNTGRKAIRGFSP